jgi:5-methyltetrahydrofolate--homocysteine methyltransferase
MAKAVAGLPARQIPALAPVTRLAGLEPFILAA